MPKSLPLSRDKDSYTDDMRVYQSVLKESLNVDLYVNAYTKHLPARLLRLFLILPIPARCVSVGAGPQLPSTVQLSNAVLRLHTYFLTEIPSLFLSSGSQHYCKIIWEFMQFLRNGLGPQVSFRMHHVITTLSENCNYPSKRQKLEEDNRDPITGSTFSSLILFFFPFSSSLSGYSSSPHVSLPIWPPVTDCPASCSSLSFLCFSCVLQCFTSTLQFTIYISNHKTQFLNS